MTERRDMEAAMEAILFAAREPVTVTKLLAVFDPEEREEAQAALAAVLALYREQPERGVMIDEVAGGYRLVTRPDLHAYLRRYFEVTGSNKLTMAALETLAIVAYRQPITGPEIQELRSVNSGGVLKTLLERRLVRITGRKEVVGKPFLYGTTREFLLHFGLKNLKELPPLEQFEELFGSENEGAPTEAGPDYEETVLREAAALADAEAEVEADAEAEVEAEADEPEAGSDDAAADTTAEVTTETQTAEAQTTETEAKALPSEAAASEVAGATPEVAPTAEAVTAEPPAVSPQSHEVEV